jgi:hypothetical protein
VSEVETIHSQTRIYRIIEGELQNDHVPLKLELVRKVNSVSDARKWLKSRECFTEQIRDRNVSQAEFLIIPEKDHYRLMPVTVIVSESLVESAKTKSDSVIRGMRLKTS